jgi:hypothetical protein
MEHPEKVLSVSFVPNNEPAEVLQPGKQSFNLPTSAIPSQTPQACVLFLRLMRCGAINSNPVTAEFCVQFVRIISVVAYQILRGVWDHHLNQGGDD